MASTVTSTERLRVPPTSSERLRVPPTSSERLRVQNAVFEVDHARPGGLASVMRRATDEIAARKPTQGLLLLLADRIEAIADGGPGSWLRAIPRLAARAAHWNRRPPRDFSWRH